MPLESATYVNQLVDTNPAHTDQISEADSHLRLIKQTLLDTFPNLNTAVTATPAQLNDSTNLTGLVAPFVAVTTNPNWLRLNGGTFLYTDHPALGTMLGFVSGTCTLPNMEDTGRFPRSVSAGIPVLTAEANQTASHTHTGSVTSSGTATTDSQGSHTHTATVTDPGHTHTVFATPAGGYGPVGGNSGIPASITSSSATTGISVGNSTDGAHTHSVTVSSTGSFTTAATGGAETRPEALTFIFYVHV